jgi:DNA polymerase III epsilon subunit-like protein
MSTHEVYISVDVESSGPIPGEYSLLSIGACSIYMPEKMFQCELQPASAKHDPEALAVTGLSIAHLEKNGTPAVQAMQQFEGWLESCLTSQEEKLVFVGFNASFDWSFINYYFHKYLGRNPFGFAALDIKALYMGATGAAWCETKSSKMDNVLKPQRKGTHDALADALYQAELFRLIRQKGRESN